MKIVSEVVKFDLIEGILFLIDLKGGILFNVFVWLFWNFDVVEFVVGVNILFLLEVFFSCEMLFLKEFVN